MTTRDQIRRDFPECAAMTEQLRAVFGPGVKPLYFSEDGKTMGKQKEDFEDDSAKWIWLAMSDAERKQAMRGGR